MRGLSWLLPVMLFVFASALYADTMPADVGHRPGLRDQWMPQTEHDPRLQQPVHIEIIGRAAAAAMKLLSEATGVSLGIAPEDIETVGDRKLTIIAQGCSLKALLVQIPKALQECHVDIDTSGKEPAYLLHRNGDVETTMAQLVEEAQQRQYDRGPSLREERVASARKALAMSPAELDDLAKTDPLLAAAVRDPKWRKPMELFFSLPPDMVQEFVATGNTSFSYPAAPAAFQAAAREVLQKGLAQAMKVGDAFVTGLHASGLSNPDAVTVGFGNLDDFGFAYGTGLGVRVVDREGHGLAGGIDAIPPRLPSGEDWSLKKYRDLLLRTRTAGKKNVDALLANLVKEREREIAEARDQRRAVEWREPRGAELHKEVVLPFQTPVDPVQVQQFVAKETGLSLVSDYFTAWGPQRIPDEAKVPMPVWRLLYLLGDDWFWSYDWNEAGDCLVFHDRLWYVRTRQEFPESLAAMYRRKLQEQGRLTLDDIAALAVEVERRKPTSPGLPFVTQMHVPADLEDAGVPSYVTGLPILIYASLTPKQRAKAESAEGLPYTEMTGAQQDLVRRGSTSGNDTRPLPDHQIGQAIYRIKKLAHVSPFKLLPGVELGVEFPSRVEREWVALPLPPAGAPSPTAGGNTK